MLQATWQQGAILDHSSFGLKKNHSISFQGLACIDWEKFWTFKADSPLEQSPLKSQQHLQPLLWLKEIYKNWKASGEVLEKGLRNSIELHTTLVRVKSIVWASVNPALKCAANIACRQVAQSFNFILGVWLMSLWDLKVTAGRLRIPSPSSFCPLLLLFLSPHFTHGTQRRWKRVTRFECMASAGSVFL